MSYISVAVFDEGTKFPLCASCALTWRTEDLLIGGDSQFMDTEGRIYTMSEAHSDDYADRIGGTAYCMECGGHCNNVPSDHPCEYMPERLNGEWVQ